MDTEFELLLLVKGDEFLVFFKEGGVFGAGGAGFGRV